jgi:NADH-quinone oxidoreductase subunit B
MTEIQTKPEPPEESDERDRPSPGRLSVVDKLEDRAGRVETRDELRKRTVRTPDGQEIEVDPLQDYYCSAPPTVMPASYSRIVESLFNWARA